MKIAVIGANGRAGTAFVEVALRAGHEIRAGVHRRALTIEPSEQLVTMSVDATDATHVGALIDGCDAVVSLIGHVKNSPAKMQTEAITQVIAQMKARGQTRLVSLTGTGVRMPGDTISLVDRFMNSSIAIADPRRISDGIAHVKVIQSSELDWTVIRVLKLTNGKRQRASLTTGGPALTFVSRHTVASTILDVLEASTYLKQAPVISKIMR